MTSPKEIREITAVDFYKNRMAVRDCKQYFCVCRTSYGSEFIIFFLHQHIYIYINSMQQRVVQYYGTYCHTVRRTLLVATQTTYDVYIRVSNICMPCKGGTYAYPIVPFRDLSSLNKTRVLAEYCLRPTGTVLVPHSGYVRDGIPLHSGEFGCTTWFCCFCSIASPNAS